MDKLKEAFKTVDPRLKIILGVMTGILLIFLLIGLFAGGMKPGVYTKKTLEEELLRAGQKYIERNPDKLKEVGDSVELTNTQLESEGFVKSFSVLNNKDNCTGKVVVVKLERKIVYRSKVLCDKEKSNLLSDKIMKDLKSDPSTKLPGLYRKSISTRSGGGAGYIYRGMVINNFVRIDQTLYRILGIDGNGNIRLIQENKTYPVQYDYTYNKLKEEESGFNDFNLSNMKRELDSKERDVYKSDEVLSAILVPSNYCIGPRGLGDTDNDGSLECSERTKPMLFGLLSASEYMLASLSTDCYKIGDRTCNNYNFLRDNSTNFWTGTSLRGTLDEVLVVKYSGLESSLCNKNYTVRPVITVRANIEITKGDGTRTNPYFIN